MDVYERERRKVALYHSVRLELEFRWGIERLDGKLTALTFPG